MKEFSARLYVAYSSETAETIIPMCRVSNQSCPPLAPRKTNSQISISFFFFFLLSIINVRWAKCLLTQLDRQPTRAMKRVTHQWQPSCMFMKMPQRRSHRALPVQSSSNPPHVRLTLGISPTRDSSAGLLSDRRGARSVCQSESKLTSQICLVPRLVYAYAQIVS